MKLKYNNQEIDLIICNTFFKRLCGIMFKKKRISYALFFPKCNSIHTFFCYQNIDVIMTDENSKIIYYERNVGKNRIISNRKSRNTIETPSNYFKNIIINDILKIEK